MDANILPLTMMVYVSSFSVDIRLPNQDRFVNSGDVVSTVGVGGTDSSDTAMGKNQEKIIILTNEAYQ